MQSRNQIDEDIIRYTRYLVNKEHPTKSARASDTIVLLLYNNTFFIVSNQQSAQSAISTISNQHKQQSASNQIIMSLPVAKNMNIPPHPKGETMKAVCFSRFGKDPEEVLEVKTIPKPFIIDGSGKNQVLIKVYAAAINPIDKVRLSGSLAAIAPEEYLDNSVLGYDVSGIIEEVTGESSFKVGDEVFANLFLTRMHYGGLAEYVVCNTAEVGRKPSNISFSEAAAFPLVGLTAYQALKRGGVKAGSKVFIPGGAGGVGSIAIQIAKKVLKAEYVCTTASPGIGTDICIECGADRVINYREDDFAVILKDENIDMVFDTMNEGYKMGDILKPNEGKVISISGSPTIEAIEEVSGEQSPALMVKVVSFFTRNRKAEQAASKVGCDWEYMFMVPSGDELNELAPYLESGEIKVIIDKIAPSLDDFMVAVDRLWSGNSKGKNVIKVI